MYNAEVKLNELVCMLAIIITINTITNIEK